MNPLFQKVITGIEQNLDPKDRDPYFRIVKAGLTMMTNKQTHDMLLQGIDQVKNVPDWAGEGIAGVLGMLAKQARGTMPFQPMLKAGVTLLMHALDFLSEAGKVEANDDTISNATKAYSMALLGAFGINSQKLQELGQKADAVMGDPQKAALVKQQLQGANHGTA